MGKEVMRYSELAKGIDSIEVEKNGLKSRNVGSPGQEPELAQVRRPGLQANPIRGVLKGRNITIGILGELRRFQGAPDLFLT